MKKTGYQKRTFPGPYPEPHTVNSGQGGKMPPDGNAQPEHDGGDPPLMTSHPIGVSYPAGRDFGPYTDHKGEGLYHSFRLDFTNQIPYNSGGIHPHTGLLLFALALNLRPDVIVETGTFFGTSTLYLAKACEVWRQGKVYTIDPAPQYVHPSILEHPYIEFIPGLSQVELPKLMDRVGQGDMAFLTLEACGFEVLPKRLVEPILLEFSFEPWQRKLFGSLLNQFGTTDQGLGKLVARAPMKHTHRAAEVAHA